MLIAFISKEYTRPPQPEVFKLNKKETNNVQKPKSLASHENFSQNIKKQITCHMTYLDKVSIEEENMMSFKTAYSLQRPPNLEMLSPVLAAGSLHSKLDRFLLCGVLDAWFDGKWKDNFVSRFTRKASFSQPTTLEASFSKSLASQLDKLLAPITRSKQSCESIGMVTKFPQSRQREYNHVVAHVSRSLLVLSSPKTSSTSKELTDDTLGMVTPATDSRRGEVTGLVLDTLSLDRFNGVLGDAPIPFSE